ncbi:60S ribosomal protein L14 [Entomophthora muscae]|uniref:60S ribosomal protein L14 n=2 Tax=Entomophthora muscae TaxID=34485 RepID=A0ACC2T8U8_9FUNG|nr:60S ribosomal protein L14 [Entomophthora muscae]KAJ9086122.1 60S ribosomal protein L14 [Entomophthora muscae]
MTKVFKRYVEVGRGAVLRGGKYDQKLVIIVDIVDHNRALVEGPTSDVPRHVEAFKNMDLTNIVIPKLPRGASTKYLKACAEKAEVAKTWAATAWSIKIEARKKRAALNDFERFNVMVLKKKRSALIAEQQRLLKKQSA